jgi:hypothetical protein
MEMLFLRGLGDMVEDLLQCIVIIIVNFWRVPAAPGPIKTALRSTHQRPPIFCGLGLIYPSLPYLTRVAFVKTKPARLPLAQCYQELFSHSHHPDGLPNIMGRLFSF